MIPRSDPVIRGAVRGPGELGSLLIVAGVDSLSCDLEKRAQVKLGRATIRRRSGGAATPNALVVGTIVSVWTTGLVIDICPGVVTARTVVIEDD